MFGSWIVAVLMLTMPMFPALEQISTNELENSSRKIVQNYAESNETEYYALIAGCCEYKEKMHNIPLFHPFPSSTMKYVYNELINATNWKKENIILLLNEKATKENITNSLNELSTIIDKNDVFLFSWMGHGTIVPDQNGDENGFFDEAICPYDTSADGMGNVITDDELNKCFSSIDAEGQIILFESCMSGGMADEKNQKTLTFSDVNNKNRIVVMLTLPNRLGYAFYDIAWPISFLYSMALSNINCDINHDGWISAEEAFNHVDENYYNLEKNMFLTMINKTTPRTIIINFLISVLLLNKINVKPILNVALSGIWSVFTYKICQNENYKQLRLRLIYVKLRLMLAENNPNMVDNYSGELNLIKLL